MASVSLSADRSALELRDFNRSPLAIATSALLLMIAVQLVQVFHRAINWDEFWHYSQIHQLAAGTLGRPLQTLHTRLFAWVINLPGTGVDHIVIIRLFMFGCEMVTTAAIVALASRFADRTTAVLCALAYIGFPYVFQHGYSFRFDPPAAALLMASLCVLTYSRLSVPAILLTGVLLGIAPMITIKIVLYAPVFAGVLWLRWTEENRSVGYLLRLAGVAVVAACVFAAIYAWHVHGQTGQSGNQTKTIVTHAAGSMFGLKEMPYRGFALFAVALAPFTVLLIGMAPFRIRNMSAPIAERLALAGFLLPVTTLAFYHNTAPYYYAFMMPPVLVACSAAMPWLLGRFGPTIAALMLAVPGLATLAGDGASPIDKQRTLLQAIETAFPAPVHYFDFCGFIGRYPKANGFMTPVVIDVYRSGRISDMRSTMERKVVPLLVENDPMFTRLFAGEPTPEFLPQDALALRENYIHFWGPYWIAGRIVRGDGRSRQEHFLVPGPYTVHDAPISVNGRTYRPGQVVKLERGVHQLRANAGQVSRLMWGEHIKAPSEAPPELPYWTRF